MTVSITITEKKPMEIIEDVWAHMWTKIIIQGRILKFNVFSLNAEFLF